MIYYDPVVDGFTHLNIIFVIVVNRHRKNFIVRKTVATALLNRVQNVGDTIIEILVWLGQVRGK